MQARFWLLSGSFGGMTAVLTGAFGAHGLKDRLSVREFNAFMAATEYQMVHSLLLLIIGVLLIQYPKIDLFRASGLSTLIGVLLFSGSLYLLSLANVTSIALVTPLGGVLLVIGWFLLLLGCFSLTPRPES